MFLYLIIINIVCFLTYGYDKSLAKRHKYRISEKTLLSFSLLGASIGALIAMYTFNHKRKKPLFVFVNFFAVLVYGYFCFKILLI